MVVSLPICAGVMGLYTITEMGKEIYEQASGVVVPSLTINW